MCPPRGEGEPFYAYGLTPLEKMPHLAEIALRGGLRQSKFLHDFPSRGLGARLDNLPAEKRQHLGLRSPRLLRSAFVGGFEGFAGVGVVLGLGGVGPALCGFLPPREPKVRSALRSVGVTCWVELRPVPASLTVLLVVA